MRRALLLTLAVSVGACRPDAAEPAADGGTPAPVTLEVAILDDEVDVLSAAAETALPRGMVIMNEGVTAGIEAGGEPRFALASYARIVKGPDETIEQTRERALGWLDRRGLPPEDRFVFAAVDEEDEATGKQETVAWRTYVAKRAPVLTGRDVAEAKAVVDTGLGVAKDAFVTIQLKPEAAARFQAATRDNLKRRLAIIIDGKVESVPMIEGEIGGGSISISLGGVGDPEQQTAEAKRLAHGLSNAKWR